MPKQKGILGVQKSQIFFSIGGEDWPSDDESDSDFEVTDEETAKVDVNESESKKKKTKTIQNKRKQKNDEKQDSRPKKRRLDSAKIGSTGGKSNTKSKSANNRHTDDEIKDSTKTRNDSTHKSYAQKLPPEVIVHILQYVVQENGAFPILCRLSKLCRSWREACSHPSLWKKVDLSYGSIKSKPDTLRWLATNRFTQIKELDLGSWATVAHSTIQVLADNCPSLQFIGLFRCVKLTSETVKLLVDKCPQLSGLDLSYTNQDMISTTSLKYIAENCGERLKTLNISGNTISGFTVSLNYLMNKCPNMREFDFSGCKFTSYSVRFPIEACQTAWTNLRTLRMACCKIGATDVSYQVEAMSPGFPKLQEFSAAAEPHESRGLIIGGAGITNDFLMRMLKTSQDLKLLDLRNCTSLDSVALKPQNIPIDSLERLYVSQCSLVKSEYLVELMKRWRHSLVELDLAWNVIHNNDILDEALQILGGDPNLSALEVINLSGTGVRSTGVSALMAGCPKLESLNLTSCRVLPRGMKRLHKGKDLLQLRNEMLD
ncbi:F-box/LRR-repeat protein 6-like [Glandiceps talaboti]